jgi:hypothetical protein
MRGREREQERERNRDASRAFNTKSTCGVNIDWVVRTSGACTGRIRLRAHNS